MRMLREEFRIYQRAKRGRSREWALARLGGACVVCGSTEDLQFDHKDPATKLFEISKAGTYAREKFEAELAKCQLLCVKHHIEKTLRDAEATSARGTHGTLSAYRYCGPPKCELCKRAKREYAQVTRGSRPRDMGPVHGKNSTYNHHKCRCDACTEAHRLHMAKRRS